MQITANASLSSMNSLGVAAQCRYLARLDSTDRLASLLSDKRLQKLPQLILGGGSNLLFAQDFPGLVLAVSNTGIKHLEADTDAHYVRAAAGENWHQFVQHCLQAGWSGLENLSLIPGTVGAAPMQNIGAYGLELKDRFHSLSAIDLQTLESREFCREDCQFGYRDSLFKREIGRYLITDVTFRLPRKPELLLDYAGIREALGKTPPTAAAVSEVVCNLRRQKLPDPVLLGNAGSFFKNPVIPRSQLDQLRSQYPQLPAWETGDDQYKLSAAWLIETAGWKGYRRGDAGVYEKHALILVNHGQATGQELLSLAEDIIDSIQQRFAITLEPEPRIISHSLERF